jgi:hypothetical protein
MPCPSNRKKERIVKSKENPKSKATEKQSDKAYKAADPAQKFTRERAQFRALIVANPNYFGNLKGSPFKPVLNIQGNTFYEEIGCVGFQPQFNRLEAVVFVKQPSGYGGDICSDGTREYVRFYLSLDNGATWLDQGLTSFATYDIPADQRLEYAVTLPIKPPRKFCFNSNQALVRAILSWNTPPPPNQPNHIPVWGNVHNTHIQIEPLRLFKIVDLFNEVKFKTPPQLEAVLDLEQTIETAPPKALNITELQALYKGKDVEPHRFALAEVQKLISSPAANVSLMSPDFTGILPGIDLGSIVGKLFPVDGDTRYEELECVGYDPNNSTLVGTIRVKLPNGYSGGLCTSGSKEFVTFWADLNNNGTFETCLGTTSVTVYDVPNIPKEGLEYAVFLPVNFDALRQPCRDGAKLVRIRAILSWQVAPPCNNPNYKPVWGNREETLIHIPRGRRVEGTVPFLSAVGNIPESEIDGAGLAQNAVALQTGAAFDDAPFGGRITIGGHISNPSPGLKYRIMRKTHGAPDISYVPMTLEPDPLVLTLNTFDGLNWHQNTNYQVHADGQGYYPFEDYSSNHSIENQLMMVWHSTPGEDGHTYDLRIDLSVDGIPAHDLHSNVVTVLVDNTAPTALLDIDLPAGGVDDCADYDLGATITGHYTATDIHFNSFSFVIRPGGPANGNLPDPPAGSRGVIPAPGLSLIADPGIAGGGYSLNTNGAHGHPAMRACGYSLTLQVWDRTNVNSGQTNNYNEASVGFCLRQKKG